MNVIENEFHFLLACPYLGMLSLNLLNANLNFFDIMISIYGSSLVSSLKIQYESNLVDLYTGSFVSSRSLTNVYTYSTKDVLAGGV